MDIYSEILSESIIKHINEKNAKPDKTIKDHTDELLKELDRLKEFGYINGEIYDLVKMACVYHDIGKINDQFQKRLKNKDIKFEEDKEIAHNVLSLYFIKKDKFKNEDDYFRVAYSVANHHDYCNVVDILLNKKDLTTKLVEVFECEKVKRSLSSKLTKISTDPKTIKIKGYLHKCDYSASSGDTSEYKNDFLEKSLEHLINKWRENNQNAKWNELQEFCIENRNENIIAIAQTGMGKTEAGLHWIGNNKGFFILPIRTAINAIYKRIEKDILDEKDIDTRLALLHSSSLEYHLSKDENESKDNVDTKEAKDVIEYEKISKQLSLPINISTMDQLFDFVYKYPGYELKLTTLSYSKIVIDEIQMYGPDLLAYLVYGLERVNEQGGKIAILTATLPPFVKDLLSENIDFKIKEGGFTTDSTRHNLKVIDDEINLNDICEKYNENEKLGKSNKILVVCNSISEAQKLYEQIEYELGKDVSKDNLHILHSKFIRKDRLKKEEEILDFGQTYKEDKKAYKAISKDKKDKEIDKSSGIWISTSIVEASLDIDFDYLFAELQDLNSLFQRLGRCNRKGVKNNSDVNCYIYTQINEKSFINGDRGYIDRDLFDLSKEAINSVDGFISEKEKIGLIDKYLNMEKIKDSNYIREYKKTYNFIKDLSIDKYKKDEVNLRNIDSRDIIPSPIYDKFGMDIRDLESKIIELERELKHSLRDKDKKLELKQSIIKLKNELNQYTVSVHPYHIDNYTRALKKGMAIKFDSVRLSDYEYLKVIECDYNELGYRAKKFDGSEIRSVDDCMI